MTWLTAKYYLKKTWLFTKKWWWAISLFIIGFLLHKFYRNNPALWEELYISKVNQFKKEVKLLERTYKEEKRKIEVKEKEYKAVLDIIDSKRKLEGKKIKREEKKRIKEIINMPVEDRATVLAEEYGFEIVGR